MAENLAIWVAEESGHIDWALASKGKAKGHRKTAAHDSPKAPRACIWDWLEMLALPRRSHKHGTQKQSRY